MDQPQPNRNPGEVFQAAIRAFSASDWKQAETLCLAVLAAHPRHGDALHMLALVLSETGRSEQAVGRLREAIALSPGNAVLWTNLGKVFARAGQFAAAAEGQREAIRLQGNFPEAHFNLGLACHQLGDFESAVASMRRATELRPGFAEAHYNLGNLYREDGRLMRAVDSYKTALQIRPDWADPHTNLAAALHDLGEPAKAIEHYRQVLRLKPGSADTEHSLGHTLMALGRVQEARAAYERAANAGSANPYYRSPMYALVRETLAEVIAPDQASTVEYQPRAAAAVRAFAADPGQIDLSELHTDAAAPSMMLAYYGGNVRPIMEQYARAISPLIPRVRRGPRRGKPKLGIVVTHGHEGVFARCWGEIAERLSRQAFDVRLVCSRAGANILQTLLKLPPDEYLRLPVAVDAAAAMLAEHQLDWLHYWEIGTDQMNYYLPFFRAAPGQSTCWGWPATSGIPEVNSYLSCEQLEPPDGREHYSEELVLMKHLPTYYARPAAPRSALGRTHFGLEESRHVYLCTQNLRKYHPEFDPLLADLLRSDPHGLLLVIADAEASITELLIERFRRTMPDVAPRVRVVQRMEREEYLALVAASDVVLDTLHYGAGANTVYDTVSVGTPLVTLPGALHRTLWAAAVNRRLGLTQLIAATPQDYVATATRIAGDADLRRMLRKQITQAGAELFEDASVVAEHEAYFSEAIAATRANV